MKKPKLLYTNAMSLNTSWMLPLVNDYFDVGIFDPNTNYDYASTLVVIPRYLHNNRGEESIDCGLRFVIDNLWESKIKSPNYVLQHENWFWYNESMWHRYHGYNNYTPDKTYNKLALMPVRKIKAERTELIKKLTPLLDQLIWSYVEQGKQLPNDVDMSNFQGQRHFDPAWYDQTYFSIVAETNLHMDLLHPVFITEKTFKPMIFWHPFVIHGNRHTLASLRELGFVTFDNLFNEDYDDIANPYQRADAVVAAVRNFVPEPYSKETYQRLQHNHERFFDQALVESRVRTEILEPLLHYAETR